MPAEVHIGCCGSSYLREQEFFDAIDRGGFLLAWEPRGMWNENRQAIIDVCEDLRLHGFGNPSMYNYDFSAVELRDLHSMIASLPGSLQDDKKKPPCGMQGGRMIIWWLESSDKEWSKHKRDCAQQLDQHMQ